jgi:acyl-CoA thioesterase YciA
MNAVEFHQPVFVGDLVSFYADVFEIGKTSIKIKVLVEAERRTRENAKVTVTQAEVVYVHVDREGHPTPIEPKAAVAD